MNTRTINLTGQRFGKLEAIKQDGRDIRGKLLWLCRCDCGGACHYTTARLRTGLTLHCGCETRRNKIQAQRFGKRKKPHAALVPCIPNITDSPINNFLYRHKAAE